MLRFFSFALLVCLAGCATLNEPIPKGFSGPTVHLMDGCIPEGRSKAMFFVVEEVDGKPINNSSHASRKASTNQGFTLTMACIGRQVPAQPMKVKLLATHQTAAPIHEFTSRLAGNFFSVEGIVDFEPALGRDYAVAGILSEKGSSVWIEDLSTNQPATAKVKAGSDH